jgi:hypothetical protein
LYVFLWERHLAVMIMAGSHSHKGDTSLPIRMAQRATTSFLRSRQFAVTMHGRLSAHYLLVFEFARKGLVCRSCTLGLFTYIHVALEKSEDADGF